MFTKVSISSCYVIVSIQMQVCDESSKNQVIFAYCNLFVSLFTS